MTFIRDTGQCFGRTALILHGGATFGLFHLGVVKALFEQNLLPRIVSGSSIGALVAALLCVHTDEELPAILRPEGIDLGSFTRVGSRGNVRRKLLRLLRRGHLMDVHVLQETLRSNVGDLTFEEAYKKSGRKLNITVFPSRRHEVPHILNYLTAPNVVIWSAALASTASFGIYPTVELLAKNISGELEPWAPTLIEWDTGSLENGDSQHVRLGELFNVNHYVVSQATPLFAPLNLFKTSSAHDGWQNRIYRLIGNEVLHRTRQMHQLGLIPSRLARVFEDQTMGNLTIVPPLSLLDFRMIISNPTSATVAYWMEKGERATWPRIALLRTRCRIELALDRALKQLEQVEDHAVYLVAPIHKRTKSIH